jgi:hypothetical protein
MTCNEYSTSIFIFSLIKDNTVRTIIIRFAAPEPHGSASTGGATTGCTFGTDPNVQHTVRTHVVIGIMASMLMTSVSLTPLIKFDVKGT